MDNTTKIRAEDMAAAYDELVERDGARYPDDPDEYGAMAGQVVPDYRPTTSELRTVARRIGQDREIREAKVEVLVNHIELSNTRGSDGTNMARRSAYRLGLRDTFASHKTLASYLVDQDVDWKTVLTMNS